MQNYKNLQECKLNSNFNNEGLYFVMYVASLRPISNALKSGFQFTIQRARVSTKLVLPSLENKPTFSLRGLIVGKSEHRNEKTVSPAH